jgi:hypothetical protein
VYANPVVALTFELGGFCATADYAALPRGNGVSLVNSQNQGSPDGPVSERQEPRGRVAVCVSCVWAVLYPGVRLRVRGIAVCLAVVRGWWLLLGLVEGSPCIGSLCAGW